MIPIRATQSLQNAHVESWAKTNCGLRRRCRGELGKAAAPPGWADCAASGQSQVLYFYTFQLSWEKAVNSPKLSFPTLPPPPTPVCFGFVPLWKVVFAFPNGILSCVQKSQGRVLPERLLLQHLLQRLGRLNGLFPKFVSAAPVQNAPLVDFAPLGVACFHSDIYIRYIRIKYIYLLHSGRMPLGSIGGYMHIYR